jgi:hypothetical protein
MEDLPVSPHLLDKLAEDGDEDADRATMPQDKTFMSSARGR